MRSIQLSDVVPGYALPSDLYSEHGIKLLGRQTQLSQSLLEYLGRIGSQFFLADHARDFTQLSVLHEIDAARLDRFQRPDADLIGLGGRITAQQFEPMEQHQIDALGHGAFKSVNGEPEEVAAIRRSMADQVLAQRRAQWEMLDHAVDTLEQIREPLHDIQAHPLLASAPNLIAWREEKIEMIRQQYTRILAGLPVYLPLFIDFVDELIGLLESDPARYPQIALSCPRSVDYLPDHAINTSAMAIALSRQRHWNEDDVRRAGLAGLLHDVGMLLLPKRLRLEAEPLSDDDRDRIRRHPAYSVSLLCDTPGIDEHILCAVHRHHERDNGKGYPEKRKARQIGDIARLLAVADMAAAMNEPRPYRPRALPHEAIQTMVQFGVDNVIQRPLVRSLVESVGLYPVGSYVRLSTTQVARVVGMNPEMVDRPIVCVCDEHGRPSDETTDLMHSEPWELSILDGVAPPTGTTLEEFWSDRLAG